MKHEVGHWPSAKYVRRDKWEPSISVTSCKAAAGETQEPGVFAGWYIMGRVSVVFFICRVESLDIDNNTVQ